MTILRGMTMADYLELKAVNAGMAHDLTAECPLYAYQRSPFCPENERAPHNQTTSMEKGIQIHYAALEPHLLHQQIIIVDADSWRTKAAQTARDAAMCDGKTAILAHDYEEIEAIRKVLEADPDVAPLLFSEGESELTYTWEWDGVPCKARIDRLCTASDKEGDILVHLKTSRSANPLAFANVGAGLGYALTCAWYLDGWREQSVMAAFDSYRIVVVSTNPPHLASVLYYDPEDLQRGRERYKRALAEFRHAQESGVWRKYGAKPGPQMLREPAWYRRQMAETEGVTYE